MKRFLFPLLLIALVACGHATQPDISAQGKGGTIPRSAAGGSDPSSSKPASAAEDTQPHGANSARAGTQGGKKSDPNVRTIPLTVTIDHTCAQRGDKVTVVAKTLKGAQVAFDAYYTADNNYTPDIFWAPSQANPTGTVTWAFTLKPTTPTGKARVQVVVAKSGAGGASYEGSFMVKDAC